jgi:hypothetical protein
MTCPVPRGEGNTEWGQMAISRLDGAVGGWWMSCLCMCQETLWALEMTRNALQFTHTGLCSPSAMALLTPLTAGVGSRSSWAKAAHQRPACNARCCSLNTATLPQSVTAHHVGSAPEIQNQKHAGVAQHNAQAAVCDNLKRFQGPRWLIRMPQHASTAVRKGK